MIQWRCWWCVSLFLRGRPEHILTKLQVTGIMAITVSQSEIFLWQAIIAVLMYFLYVSALAPPIFGCTLPT